MASVTIRNLRKSFSDAEIIKGVNLEIEDRQFTVFVGPSGCGKSTLLRLIAGLEEITSGDLIIDGRRMNDTPPAKRGLALVFQSYALYPHMSVAENMAFSLKLAGESKAERERKVREAAAILHLTELLERKPKELSGGQRQRVAIGRAIVRKPKLFLFDEPLSNLDAALRVRMRLELTKLQKQLQATMIYVTHDQVEAMTMADKIVVMRAGVIEQAGSPLELYHHPDNLFVAGFIGSPKMNFIPAIITRCEASSVTVSLLGEASLQLPAATGLLKAGDEVTVGIRPERLSLDDSSALRARVRIIERLGGESFLYLGLADGQELTMKASGDVAAAEDAEVGVRIDQAHCHLFDAGGAAIPHSSPQPDTARQTAIVPGS